MYKITDKFVLIRRIFAVLYLSLITTLQIIACSFFFTNYIYIGPMFENTYFTFF